MCQVDLVNPDFKTPRKAKIFTGFRSAITIIDKFYVLPGCCQPGLTEIWIHLTSQQIIFLLLSILLVDTNLGHWVFALADYNRGSFWRIYHEQ
ncbi:hypothetical protein M5M_11430 [Simiduia agarivorans SA1 = DSM 21679]|uniref:Uncharacterized protein n=1 Tax=Simiduia agarivorans (strain DSM 21679 / JCM 13881 / BCRC 17597 / SA1) TaxID=1117647 RepID=K4KMY9_SIMAS|nr:hypothetical protein M5M_11430 [Simiduia agarivorans SA1 = DSM 21679]